MNIEILSPSSPLWEPVAQYADACSWSAGKALARDMQNGAFTDWERVIAALDEGRVCGYCTATKTDCIPDEVLEAEERAGRIRLLAKAETGGYVIFETPDHQLMMHLGHQEYNSSRLLMEAERDRRLGRTDGGPLEGIDTAAPVNNWRANRNEFFNSWIKHVYLATPYVKGLENPVPTNEIVVAPGAEAAKEELP